MRPKCECDQVERLPRDLGTRRPVHGIGLYSDHVEKVRRERRDGSVPRNWGSGEGGNLAKPRLQL